MTRYYTRWCHYRESGDVLIEVTTPRVMRKNKVSKEISELKKIDLLSINDLSVLQFGPLF